MESGFKSMDGATDALSITRNNMLLEDTIPIEIHNNNVTPDFDNKYKKAP